MRYIAFQLLQSSPESQMELMEFIFGEQWNGRNSCFWEQWNWWNLSLENNGIDGIHLKGTMEMMELELINYISWELMEFFFMEQWNRCNSNCIRCNSSIGGNGNDGLTLLWAMVFISTEGIQLLEYISCFMPIFRSLKCFLCICDLFSTLTRSMLDFILYLVLQESWILAG